MGRKHWEKEKLLITSNFSFSHSAFKRPLLQTRKNQGLFGKKLMQSCPSWKGWFCFFSDQMVCIPSNLYCSVIFTLYILVKVKTCHHRIYTRFFECACCNFRVIGFLGVDWPSFFLVVL